jgi:hypothetical protein
MKSVTRQNILKPFRSLSNVERQQALDFGAMLGVAGEIESVCFGSSFWQTRIVVREGDDLVWWRLSDPALASNRSMYREFLIVLHRLVENRFAIDFEEIEISGVPHVCIRRPFYRALLVGAPLKGFADRQSLVRRICTAVFELHGLGLCHGHLSADNIAFDMGRVALVDIGMCAFSPSIRMQKQGTAPEVRQGYLASLPADMYGLAGVIRSLLSEDELEQRQRACLEKMESEDPTRRPTSEWVVDVFGISQSSVRLKSEEKQSPDRAFEWMGKGSRRDSRDSRSDAIALADGESANSSSVVLPFIATAFVILVLAVIGYQYQSETGLFRQPAYYGGYWRSGRIEEILKVVRACLRGDEDAQQVVLDAAFKGSRIPDVDDRILRVGFDSRWQSELSSSDRVYIFSLAFEKFGEGAVFPTRWDSTMHPAVLYALASSEELAPVHQDLLSEIPVLYLGTLPDLIGNAFQLLSGIGLVRMSDPAVLGWVRLSTGQFSIAAFESFLFDSENVDDVALFTKTDLLVKSYSTQKELLEGIYQILRSRPSSVSKLLEWFQEGQLSLWKDSDHVTQLELLVRDIPESLTNSLQLIDLILFPRKSIRDQACVKVASLFAEEAQRPSFIEFLSGPAQKFSRVQLVSILSVFLDRKHSDHMALVRNWFSMKPDPEAVARLLIVRRGVAALSAIRELDLFDVEAALYLTELGDGIAGVLTPDIVRSFLTHPEPQVRALGYQHLDPSNAAQMEILRNMLEIEPDTRLRTSIQKRIEAFAGL